MSIMEKILLISACVAPLIALLFILPKIKKKKPKTFETTEYIPEKKEEPVEVKPEIVEEKVEKKSFEDEIETYREFLQKRKQNITQPSRVELPKDYQDLTESYSALCRRQARMQNQEKNTNLHNLDPEIKALLIAGILDRKYFD